MEDSTDQDLADKRNNLQTLIAHVKQGSSTATHIQIDPDGPALQCVLSRLLAEQHKVDVEVMRRHLLTSLNSSSSSCGQEALVQEALGALDDALLTIQDSSKFMQSSFLGKEALLERYPSVMESYSEESSASGDMSGEEVLAKSSIKAEPEMSTIKPKGNKAKKLQTKSPFSKKSSIGGRLFRIILLDLPLISSFLLVAASFSARHIYHSYYEPIMDALIWFDNPERQDTEYTSYMRECGEGDVTTTNVDDLIIDGNNMTPQDAADVTNKHGVSIFPQILKPKTANAMREYVLKRNAALTSDDAIPLISQHQRWSFPIGANDDPSIPPVLNEIATHPLLSAAMEKIFGKDAAMVELTAITSAYGAGDQHWHADNDYMSSQQHYARSFVSMYSLFIPLQDTTAAMGATSACPGTHLCGEESKLNEICNGLNFQVHDSRGRLAQREEDHVWKSGDGFLMHLNTYHRGPGHTDRNGSERVMLIMSISPRPNGPYFDKRQISLGTSYSQRWDMWGLTMEDLKDSEKAMRQPWRALRALGIYKVTGPNRLSKDKWGWDHLTVGCSRIVNDQMGFRYEDLETFVKKMNQKGEVFKQLFGFLPTGEEISETGWREYFIETFERLVNASKILCGMSILAYLVFSGASRGISSTVLQVVKIGFVIGVITGALLHHLSQTPWGSQILSGKLNESPFSDGTKSLRRISGRSEDGLLSTMPVSNDILIGIRLDSPHLADHNFINDQQHGNAALKPLIQQYSGAFAEVFLSSNDSIQNFILSNIFEEMQKRKSRFLLQNLRGNWLILEKEGVFAYLRSRLASESHSMKKKLNQELLFLKSNCRHGLDRNTAMMSHHCLIQLDVLHTSLMTTSTTKNPTSKKARESDIVPATTSLIPPKIFSQKTAMRRQNKMVEKEAIPDELRFEVGDVIEGYFTEDGW